MIKCVLSVAAREAMDLIVPKSRRLRRAEGRNDTMSAVRFTTIISIFSKDVLLGRPGLQQISVNTVVPDRRMICINEETFLC